MWSQIRFETIKISQNVINSHGYIIMYGIEMEKNLSSVESVVETVISCLGYATLKKEQKVAVLSFVAGPGRDIFVSLPTSICYSVVYQ